MNNKKLIAQAKVSRNSVANDAGLSLLSTAEAIELDHRLAEDDAAPDDTVEWKRIKTEAQARWKKQLDELDGAKLKGSGSH